MRTLYIVALLAACNPSTDTDTSGDPDADTGRDTGGDVDGDTEVFEFVDDADWVFALFAGEVTAEETLRAVERGDGWPHLQEDGTWLVIALDTGEDLALAGDHNEWEPAAMTRADGFWWAALELGDPVGAGYKFVSTDAQYFADPWARHYVVDAFGDLSVVQPDTSMPHYERWHQMRSGALVPRTVRVRVPGGSGPWPVLYVQDGQNLFDAGGSFGSWHLEQAPQAADILLVGIDSTGDRVAEYTHTDDSLRGDPIIARGDETVVLVRDVVRPRVQSTWGSTGHDGLMGSSLGGLISLHIAQEDPDEWDFVASLSGTLGWGRFEAEGPTQQELWTDRTDLDGLVVYVDSGGGPGDNGCQDTDGDGFVEDDPDDSDNYCTVRAFADHLATQGFVWDETLFHWYEEGAPHNEAAWAARVSRPLQHFLDAAE